MSPWSISFSVLGEKDFQKLDREAKKRIIEKIEWLSQNFENIIPLPLTGEFKNFYKIRIGDWRVVYCIQWKEKELVIHYIDRRDKIYKKR